MRIMAKKGVTVANKQNLAEKYIKYTKGSTPENKFSKKHNFCKLIYQNLLTNTLTSQKSNTTGSVYLTWRAKIYAREMLVEVSCMRHRKGSTIFLMF